MTGPSPAPLTPPPAPPRLTEAANKWKAWAKVGAFGAGLVAALLAAPATIIGLYDNVPRLNEIIQDPIQIGPELQGQWTSDLEGIIGLPYNSQQTNMELVLAVEAGAIDGYLRSPAVQGSLPDVHLLVRGDVAFNKGTIEIFDFIGGDLTIFALGEVYVRDGLLELHITRQSSERQFPDVLRLMPVHENPS